MQSSGSNQRKAGHEIPRTTSREFLHLFSLTRTKKTFRISALPGIPIPSAHWNDTNGRFCLIDMYVPPGGGPPPHRHRLRGDLYYFRR